MLVIKKKKKVTLFDHGRTYIDFKKGMEKKPLWLCLEDPPYGDWLLLRTVKLETIKNLGTFNPVPLKEIKHVQLVVPVFILPPEQAIPPIAEAFYAPFVTHMLYGDKAQSLLYDIQDLETEFHV